MTPDFDPRLEDRFAGIDRDLRRLETDVRTLFPVIGQVGVVAADMEATEKAIQQLRGDLKELKDESASAVREAAQLARDAEKTANVTMNEVLKEGRTELVKFIGILVGAFVTIIVAIITAYSKGVIG